MESTTASRSGSLGWKLVFFVPLAVALVLLLIWSMQTNLHPGIKLPIIGNILVAVSLIAQGVYWILVRKWTGWGIVALIVASTVLGFGLHTLLRVL
jgi:hypothetical protein